MCIVLRRCLTLILLSIVVLIQCNGKIIVEDRVKEELARFDDLWKEIDDDETRGQWIGEVKALISRTLKAEDKNDHSMRREGAMDKEEELISDVIYSLVCGKNLRFRMDIFGVQYDLQIGQKVRSSPALVAALDHVKRAYKDRRDILHKITSNLVALYKQHRSISFGEENSQTKKWKGKFKSSYIMLKKVNIDLELPRIVLGQTNPNLTHLIMELHGEPNEQAAIVVFRGQCENYYWSHIQFDPAVENKEIQALATLLTQEQKHDLLQDFEEDSMELGLSFEDRNYLNDLLQYSSYFVSNSKHHESCTEVFYFSKSLKVNDLKEALEKRWPNICFAARVNMFCAPFSTLYNLISIGDSHAPVTALPQKYEPNSTHYYRYLKTLGTNPFLEKEFVFVNQILGTISFDFIIPEKKEPR